MISPSLWSELEESGHPFPFVQLLPCLCAREQGDCLLPSGHVLSLAVFAVDPA